jgi:polyisoprenoid-binding protein YceI
MKTQIAAAAIALSTLESGQPLAAPRAATTWEIDSGHSSAQFKVRHLMVSNVRGTLGAITGTVQIDENDITRSHVKVSIDARGIDTREAKRDEHLRSGDFLDVANHPTITFTSNAVRSAKGGALDVTGDLTIRGITKPVTMIVEALPPAIKDPWGNTKRGAVARASLNRKDFGLVWNMALETGGVVVGDRIDIEIEVELLKRLPSPAGA